MPLREGIQGKNYTCHYPNYNSRPSARDISPLRNSYAVSSLLQRTPLCEGLIMFGAPCSLITTPAPLQGASSNFSHDLWRHAITILAPLRGESGTSVLQHKELHYNSHPSVRGIYCRGGRIQLYYNSRPFTKDISILVVV